MSCNACGLLYKIAGEHYGTESVIIDNKFCPNCGTPLTPPQPLTLEELRGMDGKPVWVVTLEEADLNPPFWAIVDTANGHRSRGARLVGVENHDDFGAYELYNETWLAYPTEPGREDEG